MSVSVGFAGQKIVVPGSYTNINPEITASEGLPSLGTVIFIGEADDGAPFDQELVLSDNSYTAAGFSQLAAKYASGRIVDAARFGYAPSNDSRVPGGIQKLYIIKTNLSIQASYAFANNYGSALSRAYGKGGNQIRAKAETQQEEIPPSTDTFTYIPSSSGAVARYRVNGGAQVSQTIGANTTPAAFAALAWTGLAASGGTNRAIIKNSSVGQDTLAVAAISGQNATINLAQAGTGTGVFNAIPQEGDTFQIPSGSAIAGAGNANVGWYIVKDAAASTIDVYKVTAGAPVAVSATPVVSTSADAVDFAPVELSIAPVADDAVIQGAGCSLEIYDGSGAVNISTEFYQKSFTSAPIAVTFISTNSSPKIIDSSAELQRKITLNRQDKDITEELIVGGDICLRIGYFGTSASLTIANGVLTTTVVGGSGANLSININDYSTVNDLANYISAQTGYAAAASNIAIGLHAPADLDAVSAIGICAEFAASEKPAKIKLDYAEAADALNNSQLVTFADGSAANAGLPENFAYSFFAGGALGATTAARYQAALDAAQKIQDAAFIVPLFSRDASEDIVDGETDSGSSYEIDGINASTQAHCVLMSGLKQKRERIAMLSKEDSYANVKEASFNLTSGRSTLVFQEVRIPDNQGNLEWFQPFMFAVGIAGMQSGVTVPSRPVTFKTIAVSGIRQLANDFDPIAQEEDAIEAGLIIAQSIPGTGFRILLGNTTFLRSDGTAWFYSRLGVQYSADVLSKSIRSFIDTNYIGLSNAELSAESVKNGLVARLLDLRNQGILVGDDKNKGLGFRALVVQINGSSINVDVIVTIAEGIEFGLVNISAARVSQSA